MNCKKNNFFFKRQSKFPRWLFVSRTNPHAQKYVGQRSDEEKVNNQSGEIEPVDSQLDVEVLEHPRRRLEVAVGRRAVQFRPTEVVDCRQAPLEAVPRVHQVAPDLQT